LAAILLSQLLSPKRVYARREREHRQRVQHYSSRQYVRRTVVCVLVGLRSRAPVALAIRPQTGSTEPCRAARPPYRPSCAAQPAPPRGVSRQPSRLVKHHKPCSIVSRRACLLGIGTDIFRARMGVALAGLTPPPPAVRRLQLTRAALSQQPQPTSVRSLASVPNAPPRVMTHSCRVDHSVSLFSSRAETRHGRSAGAALVCARQGQSEVRTRLLGAVRVLFVGVPDRSACRPMTITSVATSSSGNSAPSPSGSFPSSSSSSHANGGGGGAGASGGPPHAHRGPTLSLMGVPGERDMHVFQTPRSGNVRDCTFLHVHMLMRSLGWFRVELLQRRVSEAAR
jgi:hypothetical protein